MRITNYRGLNLWKCIAACFKRPWLIAFYSTDCRLGFVVKWSIHVSLWATTETTTKTVFWCTSFSAKYFIYCHFYLWNFRNPLQFHFTLVQINFQNYVVDFSSVEHRPCRWKVVYTLFLELYLGLVINGCILSEIK